MEEKTTEALATATARVQKRSAPWLYGGLVLLLLSVLVVLQVFGLWEVFTPDTASDTLLLYALSSLNFAAFFVFTFIFIRSLLKLRRERRERLLGSKLKTRLVVYFIAVSLLPITAMALFSYIFFNRTLEKYFSSLPEEVVREAKRVQLNESDRQAQSLESLAATVAVMLDAAGPEARFEFDAAPVVRAGELAFMSVLLSNGKGESFAATPVYTERQDVPQEVFRQIVESNGGSAEFRSRMFYEARAAGRRFDVAVVPLADLRALVVARERRDDESLNRLVAGAQTFEDSKKNQRKVRLLGLSTLGLLTLLLLFAATWSAIHLARGIGAPIRALAEAADEVAAGNLDHRVDAIADDELAVLAASFNDMTAQLAESRRSIERNAAELSDKNLALEERRNYIETVLQTVSTGVVSLDESNRVTTINAAARSMLRLERAPAPNVAATPLSELIGAEDFAVIDRVLARARLRGRGSEQVELARGAAVFDSSHEEGENGENGAGVIPVALTATALAPRAGETRRGVVLVIEDLSELLAAQRAAAWSEVARRLAHEIKNPLTPIQLSAERIARNFRRAAEANGGALAHAHTNGGDANGKGGENERVARVVEECTATISREVAGLKAMVDEFTRFARLPHARLAPADLNEVVRQSIALYEDRLEGVRLDVLLAPRLPAAMLDAEQMRRVFVNLIENSIESLASEEGERRITIATAHDPARGLLIAEVADTGHGIARADFARLFQPYFSTRGRETGLGLAIVQRIMAEHGGRIRAEQNRPRGARMLIELPVAEE